MKRNPQKSVENRKLLRPSLSFTVFASVVALKDVSEESTRALDLQERPRFTFWDVFMMPSRTIDENIPKHTWFMISFIPWNKVVAL